MRARPPTFSNATANSSGRPLPGVKRREPPKAKQPKPAGARRHPKTSWSAVQSTLDSYFSWKLLDTDLLAEEILFSPEDAAVTMKTLPGRPCCTSLHVDLVKT
eukprot:symbB.v1.2.017228.t1/scaffold1342.1/size124297/1